MASAAILAGGLATRFGGRNKSAMVLGGARALLADLEDLKEDADIVVPRTERGYHPLCAVYTRQCLPALARRLERASERRLERGELRMTGLFEDVRVRVVEKRELERFGDTAQLLANVNTPAEFDELESLLGHNLKS